ncbi:hypothetical protein H0H93_013916 [Arthromyces matolae]|nr:hypothetical protein H0H93_013916 [Arthromyces matolae]
MKIPLIWHNLVVATCVLLVLTSPIPQDTTYFDPESIDAAQDRSVPEPGTNSFHATTDILHREDSTESELWRYKERGFHISDLAKRAGPAGEAAGETADRHDEKSATKQERLLAGVMRAPKGHWLPPNADLSCPRLPPDLEEAYDNPLTATAKDLERLIQFLDERDNYNRKRSNLSRRWKNKIQGKAVGKPRDMKPVETKIPERANERDLQRELARLVLTHREYRLKQKVHMLKSLDGEPKEQSESNTVTPSVAADSWQQPNTSSISVKRKGSRKPRALKAHWLPPNEVLHCPRVPQKLLSMAYNNPLTASVEDLEGVIRLLDDRWNRHRRINSFGEKWDRKMQGKPSRKSRALKLFKTNIPDIADERQLKWALARSVLTHRYYHLKRKTQLLKSLDEEEQSYPNAATSSAASGSQQPNTLSSHPVLLSTPSSIDPDVHGHAQLENSRTTGSPTGNTTGQMPPISMPGGRLNPFSLTRMVNAVQHAKDGAHDHDDVAHQLTEAKLGLIPFVDIEIQFIGASGLPKMDVVGSADPYFIANIDDKISYVSSVKGNTLAPVWNEIWRVKNVPAVANLNVEVRDKDEDAPIDDYIGKFKTSIAKGAKEVEIEGPLFRKARGTFWIKVKSSSYYWIGKVSSTVHKITSEHSTDTEPSDHPYLFDGPIRFTRHYSPTVGMLTNLDDQRLYSTWKIYLRGIPLFFGDKHQGWNRNYRAAQSIFQGPTSIVVRSGIQAGHRMLYARNARSTFGVIKEFSDLSQLLHAGQSNRPGSGQFEHRIKPAVYTYIISSEDDSFRFSETGAAFFVDFASKHALHSNCSETVRYSGEFHPRPKGGWGAFSDDLQDNDVEWELVFDNNSGTYAPDKTLLPQLRELLMSNFPGFMIYAWDREDPQLEESREACRRYAINFRGVGTHELQPYATSGEETLSHQAAARTIAL